VLVKVLHLESTDAWKIFELFERTAKVLESLQHSRIPAYRDHFELPDEEAVRLCLVRDYVAGESLQDVIDDGGSISEEELVDYAIELLEILDYLHSKQPPIIHRDIKPANIIRNPEGLYLVDFGAVQADIMSETGGSTVVGTAGYVAPEQLMGRAQPSSDIYALGITLAHLLSRKAPTEFPTDGFEVQLASELGASSELTYVLTRMTRADVDQREDSAERLLETFKALSDGRAITVRSSTLPIALPRGSTLELRDDDGTLVIETPRRLASFLRSSQNRLDLVVTLIFFSMPFVTAAALTPWAWPFALLYLVFAYALWRRWEAAKVILEPEHLVLSPERGGTVLNNLDGYADLVPTLRALSRAVSYDSIRKVVFASNSRTGRRTMVLECEPDTDLMPGNIYADRDQGCAPRAYALEFGWTQGEEIWFANLLNARLEQHRELAGKED